MKIEKAKLSLTQTKNPLYFQLGLRVDSAIKDAAKLSHEGMAFAVINKDELKALMQAGFKPFCSADVDIDLREEANEDALKPKLLKFTLNGAKFHDGLGTWDEMLKAEPPKKDEQPKGF